jgi:RNA polymerase sigma factor (sigma-70 family)
MNLNLHNFEQLYHQYKVLVFNVALNYLQNTEDAEEITQDVFVQVHQSMEKFQNNSTLKTWIYRFTINKCLDFIKHKSSKKRFFIFGTKTDSEKELHNVSSFEHPGIELEQQENAKILFEVIGTLNENQRTAFILSKLDGLSNPEIASIMEVSISAVESLVFRAKMTLKEKLSHKFEEYRKKN